jgi:hypothetical protein
MTYKEYLEAKEEVLYLWNNDWITWCETRAILRSLYRDRYLMKQRIPIRTERSVKVWCEKAQKFIPYQGE